MEVTLIGVSITPVGSILVTTIEPSSPSSIISTLNTVKIYINLDRDFIQARDAILAAVDAINEKFNEHGTEL